MRQPLLPELLLTSNASVSRGKMLQPMWPGVHQPASACGSSWRTMSRCSGLCCSCCTSSTLLAPLESSTR